MLFVRDFLTDQTILRDPAGPSTPLISVVLPTYARRASGMLERSIASVLAQSLGDFELLVVDDGSTDGSYDLIERFREGDPRVIHIRHERNSGIHSIRLNEGMALARGKYIAFQFDDDCWRPNALADLAAEAERQSGPAVVVGKAYYTGKVSEGLLPEVELNLVNLYEQNRLVNNSVLVPRAVVERYGMYDCHLGMRRLCDWDLWLRYIKHVPFVAIDSVVSDMFMSNPGSLGLTVPWTLSLFYYLHAIQRDHLLTPDRWQDYEVDALQIDGVELANDFRRQVYEEHVLPYYLKFRHHFPALDGFSPNLPARCKTVLCTKASYDVSNDVTLGNYDRLAKRRGNFKAYFQPLNQVEPDWTRQADALLLVRTVEDRAKALLDQSLAEKVPVGFYLDDDMLTFHEYGKQFDYLAPGTPFYQNLTAMLPRADTVWVTNRFIDESVRPLNPRVIPHNNSIPRDMLPAQTRRRDPSKPFRIGYVGSGYRIDEFKHLWDAFVRISQEYGDRVLFEFWGLDVRALGPLASPVLYRPYTFSYARYVADLKAADFDLLLSPLLDYPRPRLGKSVIKYYETAVAGAVGIFSDVPQYDSLPAGLSCFKAKNTADDWYRAMSQALALSPADFDLMRTRLLEHVREEFTETAQINKHEAALRATEFHGMTRDCRYADGRPRVLYVLHSPIFGGGEIQLWRRLRLARRYGIEPIIVLPRGVQGTEPAQRVSEMLAQEHIQLEFSTYVCFNEPRTPSQYFSEPERADARELIERCKPALVHTVTFIPSFGQICAELHVPHVASMYAVDDRVVLLGPGFHHCDIVESDSLHYANLWSKLLGVDKFCSRQMAPQAVFDLGLRKHLESVGQVPSAKPASAPTRFVVSGTVQERKSHLEMIEALGRLSKEGLDCQLDIYGYTHFYPKYLAKCRESIQKWSMQDRVLFKGFSEDIPAMLESADVLLSLSTFESFPGAIKDAMAAGVLVVATPVGGIRELIVDGVSGILCQDTSLDAMVEGIRRALKLAPDERHRITEHARHIAHLEMHPDRAINDLMALYTRALLLSRGAPASPRANLSSLTAPARYGSSEYSVFVPANYLPQGDELSYHVAWRVAGALHAVRMFLAPAGGRRERVLILTARAGQLWQRAGPVALGRRIGQKVMQRLRYGGKHRR